MDPAAGKRPLVAKQLSEVAFWMKVDDIYHSYEIESLFHGDSVKKSVELPHALVSVNPAPVLHPTGICDLV